jgi:hypothetical protein
MKAKIALQLLVLGLAGAACAQNTYILLSEDFEGVPLETSLEEAAGTPDVWTDTPPEGWVIDESGVPGIGDLATDGMTEWAGWALTDKDWWTQVAGDQRRSEFTLGEGTVAVADPDEWDDSSHPGPIAEDPYDTWLSTPPIDLSSARPGSLQLRFDSSWRPEYDDSYHQTASLTVSYDGGDPIELFRWESNSTSPNFKDDNSTNETIFVPIDNPAGATSMVLTFGLFDAGNDWWWAIDNILLTGERLADRAYNASPEHRAEGLSAKTVLSWTPGAYVDGLSPKHKVILAEDRALVEDGSAVVSTQDANSFDASGLLDFDTTYYWRIDEANAVSGWDQGNVWSFSVEALSFAVPVDAVSASASSSAAPQDPQNTVDASGLNENDEHSNLMDFMWMSDASDTAPWIQFDFARTENLDRVHVWNHNSQTEAILGFGMKEVVITTSFDGQAWQELGIVEMAQASGLPNYTGFEIDLGGIAARAVKLTVLSNWSILGLPQTGLSEVRFFAIPMQARLDAPADGASDVDPLVNLSWRAGRQAVQHEVWLGTEPDALSLVATVDHPSHTVALDMNSTAYWRIHEVNEAADPAVWEGSVWSFTTSAFVPVDDMETYKSQDGSWIWETWTDGFDDSTNGALLGHNGDDMEKTTVYEGRQSLPYFFGQNGIALSEASRPIDRDWSQHGIVSFSMMCYGKSTNVPGQMYIKVNGTKVATHPTPSDQTLEEWKTWSFDLPASSLGQVSNLTIGFEGGSGMVFIDAIRLQGR